MKTEIALMMVLTTLGLGVTYFETNQTKKLVKDAAEPSNQLLELFDQQAERRNDHLKNLPSNDQYFNAFIIMEVFSHYSAAKMEKAIELTYDENVLSYKNAFEIMTEMSPLIKSLRNADKAEIIFEANDLISLRVNKGKKTFQLDIHFKEYSQKIEKMEYTRLD